jgi:hypothetical protein
VRIWNGEYEVSLNHVRMFASTKGTFEVESFEFLDEMEPGDRG